MSRTSFLSDTLYQYILAHTVQESDLLRRLHEETQKTEMPQMQIAADQGKFLALLVQLIGAVNTLEIGVFTGYSSICVAQALPAHGKIVACDTSEEWTSVAKRYWKEAGVAQKIDLRISPALETLERLEREGKQGFFDFVFIDADKLNLPVYYEHSLRLIRPRGLIAIDNVLRGGNVADRSVHDEETAVTRALNDALVKDPRIEMCMLGIADGLTLAMKK